MLKAREHTLLKTGYDIIRKGKQLHSFEFDSKSFNNQYYAFCHRHNSNKLRPDPAIVEDF